MAGFDGVDGLRVESVVIGQTYEGREIKGFKAWTEDSSSLSRKGKGKGKGKKGKGRGREEEEEESEVEREFVVQSGQHAREVSSGSLS